MTRFSSIPAEAPRHLVRSSLNNVRKFSTSSRLCDYAETLKNLKIGAHTRVLFQGFTGKQATIVAQESLAWGTKIVGGVKPGVDSAHLGRPIFPSVRAARIRGEPDASAIFVPGDQTARAIEEAIEEEIPLVVAVAEHVPIHDMLRVHSMLKSQSKTRLLGANCPGIISPIGKCRVGFQPLPCFSPGNIGIVTKSGTLSYEAVASTTRSGLGQSLCIGIGGDPLVGTNFVDALNIFEEDPDTLGIILVGEIGGRAELDAADWIKDYHQRNTNPKPIMGLIGGMNAIPGRIMGHAGAWASYGEPNAYAKYEALERAGVVMVNHPEKFGVGIKTLLKSRTSTNGANQRRGLHTKRRMTRSLNGSPQSQQTRSLFVKRFQALEMIKEKSIPVNEAATSESDIFLSLTIDRTALSPCILASPSAGFEPDLTGRFPFAYEGTEFSREHPLIETVASHLQLPTTAHDNLAQIFQGLWQIFTEKEAYLLEVRANTTDTFEVRDARFGFDDAAFRSSGRQAEVQQLRNPVEEVAEEVEAERNGIFYIKLKGHGSIGILVNGAGLAMNTVDALTIRGGHCANFLDTGGKATTEMVKSSLRIITSDRRVKAIFVNIFGGLTKCDMIAEGIIQAFEEMKLNVPVVVRLRGTNEARGQLMISRSGLPLEAFDGFEAAALRVIELAGDRKHFY
ncbi:succinyl-CoA synthetase subunit alpha [Aspergillus sclerotioniger CBS 115572]|uniref:Succinyl-CoA synthetase subunit alpha n=1 Tax=Aspergillus sclerotioniger CBS 115572 TaxID=1450535 RepID=A0A317WB04_9EURO|nr:succinyl-CoA synthetase subunit alpha [Aspergillus sclerotioniger CBS 115572]PWY83095.1 succinyl-CoA synthetase subunit alpha [Aspergillus sclerotioniger CBS 115572]